MDVSIILCTYNRSPVLPVALDSVLASVFPASVKWELLVVDNNSTDNTRSVVEGYCRRHPGRCRYIFESRQGLSNARNAGISNALGDVLAFVDDDITVEPLSLHRLTACLHTGEWKGAAGRILMAGDYAPPDWLRFEGPYAMGGILYAHFDLGDKPGRLTRPPHGANMAFRKEVFHQYGGYRTDLGRCGENLLSNEDTEFGRRLLAAGEPLKYEPDAVVYHPVMLSRVRQDYFLEWWFEYGRAMVREWGPKPSFKGIPRSYLSILKLCSTEMVQAMRRWLLAGDRPRRFFWKCRTWMLAGEIAEFYRAAKSETNAGAPAIPFPAPSKYGEAMSLTGVVGSRPENPNQS